MITSALRSEVEAIGQKAQLAHWAVALCDLESGEEFGYEATRLFHAASTYKAAVLLGLLNAVAQGRVRLEDQLQVRNRFISVADGAPFRVEGDRDGDREVHRFLGRSLPLGKLAEAMIVRSSNLATNLLLDFLTVENVLATLAAARVEGLLIRRGVEDLAAHALGINNESSAAGLVSLFRVFAEGDFLPAPLRKEGLRIFHGQEFNRMIPLLLPSEVRVAHKTGEISTHSHDAGIVYSLGRRPYVLAILTESENGEGKRQRAVAEISAAIYRHLMEDAA